MKNIIKYIKYYLSTILIIFTILFCSNGANYPTFCFIIFSVLIMGGDLLFKEDLSVFKIANRRLINMPIYINFSLLLIFLTEIIFLLGNYEASWIINIFNNYFKIDLLQLKAEITFIDRISLIALGALYIGIIGTVPGHELTHRKKDKIDMFFGNWLLSISWDCAFALEHVYGHHKYVGLPDDPATAKR